MTPSSDASPRSIPAFLAAVTLLLGVLLSAPSAASAQASERAPAPVTVLMVIDQLRADLLDRYDEVFTAGLRRLRDDGYRFTQATHDHAITLTAPGHATLSTGTHPSRHGVVANVWIENGVVIENIVDETRSALDAPRSSGTRLDPLTRSTVGEWLQDVHPEARVLSVSGKDRAAALMAGRSDASVLWFDGAAGRFVTSDTWADAYPEWVDDFHDDDFPELLETRTWDLIVPPRHRGLAREDEAAFEADGVNTTFPHEFDREYWGGDVAAWLATTPYLDRATRLIAQAGIEGEGIGTDDIPDLVMISLSQTDRVGHAYGPRSLEQLDNLVRLDAELGEFMDWMDGRFGSDGWRMVLTADHGVADAPEQATEEGSPGHRVTMMEAVEFEGRLSEVATEYGVGRAGLADTLALVAPEIAWIEQAWTLTDLLAGGPAQDSFTVLQARSSHPGRQTGVLGAQGVEMRLTEGTLLWTVPRGTTHGSPYMYDRHVPLVVLGGGIPTGLNDEPVATVDVAPMLAVLLGIEAPDDLDGVPRPIG
ncbi:MAG TPA: alkaline phosphatase family protein [Longimicrobiales bacterium]|nr:alkaline phosphatase family protein [Longimicrobiales bacterium]